jgi:hypothetical protein
MSQILTSHGAKVRFGLVTFASNQLRRRQRAGRHRPNTETTIHDASTTPADRVDPDRRHAERAGRHNGCRTHAGPTTSSWSPTARTPASGNPCGAARNLFQQTPR